ncbi:MAG TPA: methionine--tRNA ligase [Bacteroidota bacterium]|jgi:methionyl-tRNA synthetase
MADKFKRILITAALPYANGKLHLGHLAGAGLPADIYARYQRSMKRDVAFVCGSDEHGVPITITAEQEHTTPQAIVDRYHELNKATFARLGVSFDNYSRTTLPLHHETVKEFFLAIYSAGVLREKKEKQFFDEKANMFLPDRYVEGTCPVCQNPEARGDQCERCGTYLNPADLLNPRSKITGGTPTLRETTHLYFPLGEYQAKLQAYIERADREDGWKENVLQYCRGWFGEGLQDRAVTRDLGWGVRVPLKGFEQKVLYVWFEAVLGYISSTKEWSERTGQPDRWKQYWLDAGTKYVAFLGKDNVVFHCIVFPAMLMARNERGGEQYVLPANVPANEFLNFEGQKFSKSRGWGIDVDDFVAAFPPDTLRYALTLNLPEYRDADFTWKDFQARTNNELADTLGNFVNRTLTFAHRNFGGKVPAAGNPGMFTRGPGSTDETLAKEIRSAAETGGAFFEQYRFKDGALAVMNLVRFCNKYFNDLQPWKSLKEDPDRCALTINLCLQAVRSIAILIEPVLPFTSAGIWNMLLLPGSPSGAGWNDVGVNSLPAGHPLGRPAILFSKIEDEVIARFIGQLPAAGAGAVPRADHGSQIDIDTFRKLDLRVARVVRAEKVPKSDKLLKLLVSLGDEERQLVAGIAEHYAPEELVGKSIVVVANLAPATIRGVESRGMLLAASDTDGKLAILTPEKEIDPGSKVK